MDIRVTRAVAFGLAVLIATSVSATPGASLPQAANEGAMSSRTPIIPVHGSAHDDWDDEEVHQYGAHYRRHHAEHHVDAPFTRVESGRRVIVDAPFAHVYVGREGRHVVAPFVDLWIPRRR